MNTLFRKKIHENNNALIPFNFFLLVHDPHNLNPLSVLPNVKINKNGKMDTQNIN